MTEDDGADPKRVDITGISNGGFMSVRLAMELAEKITAVAPVAAQVSDASKNKTPQLPISIMVVMWCLNFCPRMMQSHAN